MVEDICGRDDEALRAYCFCCPAMQVDDFRLLYTLPLGSDLSPVTSAKGKSAQDIFGECIMRKNKGLEFVLKAGSDTFHTEEELHEFLVRAATQATAHIDYAMLPPSESTAWLANMPTDVEAGWNAAASDDIIRKEVTDAVIASGSTPPQDLPAPASLAATVAEVDQAVSSWKDVRRNVTVHLPEGGIARQTNPDGSLVTLPSRRDERPVWEGLQLDPRASHTEHVMIINRQVQHVGWSRRAQNQFAVLDAQAPPALADDPSEVAPNA
jgi:hypothetical protein